MEFEAVTVAGQDNTLGMPISIPPLDATNSKVVGGDQDVTLTMANVPGFEVTVFANSARFLDNSRVGRLTLSQVQGDKVPMPPPNGLVFNPPAWTIQPHGVEFNPPAKVKMPNSFGLPPGTIMDLYSFDHAIFDWADIGKGTVTEDGQFVVSDPGFGITHAGWGGGGPPPPPPTCTGNPPACSKCDSSSGGWIADPAKNGQSCADASAAQSFSVSDVDIKVDDSCKGVCQNGSCGDSADGFNVAKFVQPIKIAIAAAFSSCIDSAQWKDTFRSNLKSKGVRIVCKSDASGQLCGSAALNGNTFTFYTNGLAPGCGPLASTIFHELIHSHAGQPGSPTHNTNADYANDSVYGCEKKCFPAALAGDASACK
jgi:hypothetical protein